MRNLRIGLLAVGIWLVACFTKGQARPLQAQSQMPQQAQASNPRKPVRLQVPFLVRQGKGFLALVRDPTGEMSESDLRSA